MSLKRILITFSLLLLIQSGNAYALPKPTNNLPSYVTIPLSKKFSNIEKLDKEIVFTKDSLDTLNSNNSYVLTLDKKSMVVNSLISTDLISMANAYLKDNKTKLRITSTYRSFTDQSKLRNRYGKIGQQAFSTPSGTSEHHLGTTIDFGLGGNQAKYAWLEKNSWKYGFLRSYGTECSDLTGIKPEEWHYRWVGTKNAKEYMDLKSLENAKGRKYCPLSYFRLKAGKWPE